MTEEIDSRSVVPYCKFSIIEINGQKGLKAELRVVDVQPIEKEWADELHRIINSRKEDSWVLTFGWPDNYIRQSLDNLVTALSTRVAIDRINKIRKKNIEHWPDCEEKR